jgi:hypothetical protein
MRRSPIARRTPLRRVSLRRQRVASLRRLAVAEALLRADYRCEGHPYLERVGAQVACDGPLDPHEPLTRARGGSIVDPDNIVIVCRNVHNWTHANPSLATEAGLLRSAWSA